MIKQFALMNKLQQKLSFDLSSFEAETLLLWLIIESWSRDKIMINYLTDPSF